MSTADEPLDLRVLSSLLQFDEQVRLGVGAAEGTGVPECTDDRLIEVGKRALECLESVMPRRSRSIPTWAPGKIGSFELVSVLGAGGFAVVYQAYDPRLNRDVALKVPRPHALVDAGFRGRFLKEARLAASLDHSAIVQVYEAGIDGDLPYIACALCEGPTLERWLAQQGGRMRGALAAQVVRDLADGLHYSHECGILHRDLKPANILLFPVVPGTQNELPFVARIGDFGLARLIEDPLLESRTSQLVGTPRFMAPELLNGTSGQSSISADVYSLGAVLYAMLTGQPPFMAESLAETVHRICTEDAVSPAERNPEIERDLSLICLKCLEKSPTRRYPNAAELRDDLDRFLSGHCIAARPASWTVRVRKWYLRNPLRILLTVALFTFLSLLTVISYRYTFSIRKLQNRLVDANTQLRARVHELDDKVQQVNTSREEADDATLRARNLLQIADINLAGLALLRGDPRSASLLLKPWTGRAGDDVTAELTGVALSKRYLLYHVYPESQILADVQQSVWSMSRGTREGEILLAGSGGRLESIDLPLADAVIATDSKVWDVLPAEINCVTRSDDGSLVAACGDDGQIRVWSVQRATGLSQRYKLRHALAIPAGKAAYGVQFLPRQHCMVCCDRTSSLSLWDADTGVLLREIRTGHRNSIESMTMSHDQTLLATTGADGSIELFRIPRFESFCRIDAGSSALSMVAFSEDDRYLVSAGGRTLKMFELPAGRLISQYSSLARLHCVISNRDGEFLVGDQDGTLQLFGFPTASESSYPRSSGSLQRPIRSWIGHDSAVSAIWCGSAVEGTGAGAWVTADRGGIVRLWHEPVPMVSTQRLSPPESAPITETDVSLVSASCKLRSINGGILVTRTHPVPKERLLMTHGRLTGLVQLSLDDFAACDDSGWVYRIGQVDGEPQITAARQVSENRPVHRIVVSADRQTFGVIDESWRGLILNRNLEGVMRTVDGCALAALAGNRLIRSCPARNDLEVVEFQSGRVLQTLKQHKSTINKLLFTPDGQTCVTASADRTICLWDTWTWELRHCLTGHNSAVRAIAVSESGDLLLSGDENGCLRAWDIASGRQLLEILERIPEEISGLTILSNPPSICVWTADANCFSIRF